MKRLIPLLLAIIAAPIAVADAWTDLYPAIEKSIVAPTFPDRDFNVTAYGAAPDATAAKNQAAINAAIEACSNAGGGRVVVKGGTYNTGALRLLSNVNLHVEADATILFVFDTSLYPIVATRWEGLDCYNLSPCIYAYDATNVALTGKGIVDGGADNQNWWPWCGKDSYGYVKGSPRQQDDNGRPLLLRNAEDGVPMDQRVFNADNCLRPQLVNFNKCNNVLIEDVTLLRSPFWVIHPLLCKNVTVRNVNINNDGPNGDGCDPESCDGVLIEGCSFNTGDDCIAVKSGRNNDGRIWDIPSQNIIIRNCSMKNGHGGVVIGSEITGGCRNLFAENCVMDSPNLDRVIRIKTNTCRGGVIEDIYVRNITVGQCKESVLKINLDYEPKEICCRGFIPTVRNVWLDNVTCQKSRYGLMVVGLKDSDNVYNINIDNCHFNNVAQGNSITGLAHDINYHNYYINGSLCLSQKPYKHFSEWLTRSEMQRVPESYKLDFSKKPKWSYVMGIELESMLDTYLQHGGDDILAYCKMYTDSMISPKGVIGGNYDLLDYNLDNVRTGHFVTRMYKNDPTKKDLLAIKTLMKQLEKQPRTAQGVFWHKAIYAYQVWLDGIFMGLPFRVLTAPIIYNKKQTKDVYDDAVDQLIATYEKTYDSATGLNRHAWDENCDMFWSNDTTGLSQHCWGRAQGWYTMALVEVLEALPEDYERRPEVIALLNKSLKNVLKYRDKSTGLWYQVMDSPGREGNYLESTCSAMMAYAMLKGARLGVLDQKWQKEGLKSFKGIVDNFLKVNPDSTLSLTHCCEVAGLGPGISPSVLSAAPKVKENRRRDGSYEYYLSEPIRDNDPKGVGPFIWAALEAERLGLTTDMMQ